MSDAQRHTAETFDGFSDRYSHAVNEAVSFSGLSVDYFTRVKANYLVEAATAHFGETGTRDVLDVGCGVGNYHSLIKQRVGKLHGVDVSNASIQTARANHPEVEYAAYDGVSLPYEDEAFDLAFTICVVHHVPAENWPGFFREMHRVLRPGGMAVVFEHNPRNPLTMRAVNRCPFDADAVLLRSGKTKSLFALTGFQKVRSRYILSVPAGNQALRRIDGVFSPLGLGAQYFVTARKS